MKKILISGFCGTSSEMLVNSFQGACQKEACKLLILPNDKVLDSQILLEELKRQDCKYVFSFGQKPNIRDKVYMETVAKSGNRCLHTDFEYDRLRDFLEAENITVRISDHAGTSFCNALYWSALEHIRDRESEIKTVFLHIPFCKNMTAPEDFYERIRKGIEKYCRAVQT